MKTLETVSLAVAATAVGSVALALGSGLPIPFALLVVVAGVSLAFASTIVIGALVHPTRRPLHVAGVTAAARRARPITRPARVAA